MSDLITISSSVLPYSARVVGFRGTEAMSRPYHFEIFVLLTQEIGDEVLPVAVSMLQARGIRVTELSLHLPSLDEVFFTLTGTRTETDEKQVA